MVPSLFVDNIRYDIRVFCSILYFIWKLLLKSMSCKVKKFKLNHCHRSENTSTKYWSLSWAPACSQIHYPCPGLSQCQQGTSSSPPQCSWWPAFPPSWHGWSAPQDCHHLKTGQCGQSATMSSFKPISRRIPTIDHKMVQKIQQFLWGLISS